LTEPLRGSGLVATGQWGTMVLPSRVEKLYVGNSVRGDIATVAVSSFDTITTTRSLERSGVPRAGTRTGESIGKWA